MKTLGEAAMDLPWLAPSVASLLTLARSQLPSVWTQLRTDPGFVLLSAQVLESNASFDVTLLDAALYHQPHFHLGSVDWNQPGPDVVRRTCCRQALLANNLADVLGCDGRRAWTAGYLAPIGWLAVAAAEPGKITDSLQCLNDSADASAWQRKAWGLDHTALARRLSRLWRLPAWLAPVLGHLGLHVSIAERLGAEPHLFKIVQLTVLLTQAREYGLGLSVGAEVASLLDALHLSDDEARQCVESAWQTELSASTWEAPGEHVLLPDLLRLALENRRQNDAAWVERLHQDLDHLQEALVQQCAQEKERLHTQKLSALAEFAAGAGHEINNPLAVISGQAQYVLKQMDWLDVPAEEIENVAEYLEGLRARITPSLQKIVGQTQRVHAILTELMQFARPSQPKLQAHAVRSLIQDVVSALQTLAQERKVRLVYSETASEELVHVDRTQACVALSGLLRNAIEAAPADGWARLRVEKQGPAMLELIVEDNGAGPASGVREHLFDPFFSGRSAGRGRGMGLPTAWRLARQQGGDVRFDGSADGVTRFVLSLPIAATPVYAGYHTELNGVHTAVQAHH